MSGSQPVDLGSTPSRDANADVAQWKSTRLAGQLPRKRWVAGSIPAVGSMNYTFSEIEKKNVLKWKRDHLRERHNGKEPYGGAIGGMWSFIFTPTSIATMIVVRCNHCHVEQDVTDLSDV